MENWSPDWHFARSMSRYCFGSFNNGTDSGSWKLAPSPLRYLSQVRNFESQCWCHWAISSSVQPMARRTEITEDFCSIHRMDGWSPFFFSCAHGGRAKESKEEECNAKCKNCPQHDTRYVPAPPHGNECYNRAPWNVSELRAFEAATIRLGLPSRTLVTVLTAICVPIVWAIKKRKTCLSSKARKKLAHRGGER
jgi:hypothetical protein